MQYSRAKRQEIGSTIVQIEPYRKEGKLYLAIVFSNSQGRWCEKKSLEEWEKQAEDEKDMNLVRRLLDIEKNIFWETADTPLPSEPDDDVDIFLLQRDIQRCLNDYIVLKDERYYILLANYTICTYIHEAFSHAPRILIYAPTRSGKTQLIRFMSAMCYRGHDYTNPSVAALCRDIEKYHPTICIDSWQRINDERRRELEWIYEKGFTRGGTVARVNNEMGGNQRFHIFSFMVVATKDLNLPEDLQNRSVLVPMFEGKPEKRIFDLQEISELKGRLLGLRLAFLTGKYGIRFDEEIAEKHDLSLDPRALDMAITLTAPCIDNEDSVDAILSLTRDAQKASREALKETIEADVFYALSEVIKEKALASVDGEVNPFSITVSEIAQKVNEEREHRLTPKRVGQVLRTLGFELKKGSKNKTYFTGKDFWKTFDSNCRKFDITMDVTFENKG